MEKFIILIDCEGQCIDLYCEFSFANNFYIAKITDPFDSSFTIEKENERETYSDLAKYILDKGRIISIVPVMEKQKHNFLQVYIRIEEIKRHLLRIKRNYFQTL